MDASPLARLPPELRNRIYERAVALSEPITTLWWPDTEKFSAVRRSRPTRRYPFALAQTCNAIRSETLKLTYNLNDVELRVLDADDAGYEHAVRTFLSAIGPENEAVLRSVTIYIGAWHRRVTSRRDTLLEVTRAVQRITRTKPDQ